MKDKQFRTIKDILRKNCDKYYFYSMTLDSLVHNCRLEKADAINSIYVIDDFKHLKTWSLWNTSIPQLELWQGEMAMMGLITMKENEDHEVFLSLTEEGFKAYQEQRFHSISASLFEAKYSRTLATVAAIVAIVSVIIALFC